MGKRINADRMFIREPDGKKFHGKCVHRWEDNINPLNAELNPICHLLALL